MTRYFIVSKKFLDKDNVGETYDLNSAKAFVDMVKGKDSFVILQEI